MALLAKTPGEVVTKDKIWAHLWPEFSDPGKSNPYDRDISDHKRRIPVQMRKGIKDERGNETHQAGDISHTWSKEGKTSEKSKVRGLR